MSSTQQQQQQQQQECASVDGIIVARVLPKKYIEFERQKPIERRVEDVGCWRERLVPSHTTIDSKQLSRTIRWASKEIPKESFVIILDVHLKTAISNKEGDGFREAVANLMLQRDCDETAFRTLRRLEISIQRRLEDARDDKKKSSSQRCTSSSTSNVDGARWSIILRTRDDEEHSGRDEDSDTTTSNYRQFEIDENLESEALWRLLRSYPGSLLSMDFDNEDPFGITLEIESCPPTILDVQAFEDFCADVFVDVPLAVHATVLHADRALVVWFANDEQVSHDCSCYAPTENDIGKRISVLVSPVRADRPYGHEEVYQFEKLVTSRPPLPVLEQRASWLSRQGQGSSLLRVMSYNLFADLHMTRKVEHRALCGSCDPSFLSRTRRMPLILFEILEHDADIICLQEVDATIYDRLFYPVLSAYGYEGYYSNKASTQLEGCAMFWSLRTFERAADMKVFPLTDLFEPSPADVDDWVSLRAIDSLLKRKPDLGEVVRKNVGQIVQVAQLSTKKGRLSRNARQIVVGNTHLFYHPLADHIRLMQTYVLCKALNSYQSSKNEEFPCPMILCGDLNSDPKSGAVRLLMQRKVGPDDGETWKNLDTYTWECGDEEYSSDIAPIERKAVEEEEEEEKDKESSPRSVLPNRGSLIPPSIVLPKSFPEIVSGYEPMPEFSNYVVGFAETLDYIFVSKPGAEESAGLVTHSAAPCPTMSDMKQFTAIPNESFPSDHVPLACDFQWLKT